ncbi:MAG: GNAT family N-acetyltransferase [Mucilaginibacter sp.]
MRLTTESDIPHIARLRSLGWGDVDYWIPRVTAYMNGENNPQKALPQRVGYVAEENGQVIGFVAGHLTTRLDCEGELEWIDVDTDYRRKGVASELVRMLAKWFEDQGARKICVDPGNENARKFYTANGAENLDAHWMYWTDISLLLKK